jgi:hypothetical protein
MWEGCRSVGSTGGRVVVLDDGPRLSDVRRVALVRPLRVSPRAVHVGVFTPSGTSCRHVWEEFQKGDARGVQLRGIHPIAGRFRVAEYADRDVADRLPPLRTAVATRGSI